MHLVGTWFRNDRGFALLAVTIAVAALSLMIAAVTGATRQHVDAARSNLDRVKINSAIDGALDTIVAQFNDGSFGKAGYHQTLSIGGTSVEILVRPEASKIDLNAASPALLTSLFQKAGVDSNRAMKLTDSIEDWRDEDSFARANGAEASDYISAGRGYGPANRNFDAVSELGLVLGADDALVRCLASDLTVFTNSTNVVTAHASKHVREALGLEGDPGPQSETPQPGNENTQPGALFELVARVTAADGTVVSREIVLRLTGNPKDPVWTLANLAPAPDAAESDMSCKVFVAENQPPP